MAKKKKKISLPERTTILNDNPKPLPLNNPAISIIIPMYNVEDFVGECLDSLLEQTFQDFEVIIVDDWSTDSSVDKVKAYMSKFNGRLTLSKTETNSGGCAVPRNVGFPLSRGEYIFFMDADDVLIKTGLEEMYTLAKEYDADVVYFERYYMSEGVDEDFTKNIYVAKRPKAQKPPYVDKPTLESQDLFERVQGILNERYWVTAWTKFVRRDLLDKHKILFSVVKPGEDDIWTYGLVFFAKNFLRVPNMVYVYRMRENSIMSATRTPQQTVNFWLNPILLGLKELDEFMGQIEFFKENPQQRYAVLEKHFQRKLNIAFGGGKELTLIDFYETVKNEFSKNFGEYDVLISILCSQMFGQHKALNESQQKLKNIETKFGVISLPAPELPFHPVTCAISVIIPMYNAEKYIGECLDSLLVQTFQDFEVIVANDCSTDNSVAVVESYMPKFNGRLKLTKTETNSGGGGKPRNIGLGLASGEYIFFLDSDDILTKTGLEELYTLAKEYDPEIVYCERYYMSEGVGEDFIKNIHVATKRVQPPPYVDKPTFESQDLAQRVQEILKDRFWVTPWLKLIRRDFLIKHKIFFPDIRYSEDDIWTRGLVFFSKKWLRVPNMVYVRRMHESSLIGSVRTPQEAMHFSLNPVFFGLKALDNFMSPINFFKENPRQRYEILKYHFQSKLRKSFDEVQRFATADVYKSIKDEFGKNLGDYDVLISALCAHIFNQGRTLNETEQKLKDFEKRILAKDNEIRQLKNAMSNGTGFSQISPDVSVIIAMYDSEEYIGELLDSLLVQTFTNFEVIVVDDCSTDNSIAVVESYLPKFNGRLRLSKTVKNTGKPGEPRNIGVDLSCGEYLFILDSDDAITPDAIEKLYKVAKEYDADVVTCEKFYKVPEENWEARKTFQPFSYQKCDLVSKPTLVPYDVAKRAQDFLDGHFLLELWDKLVRRKFMVENQIRSQTIVGQDSLVVYCLICIAERFVRVPYVVNYHRIRKGSLYTINNECEPIKKMRAYLTLLNVGLNYLDNLLSKREFFQENPGIKRFALNCFVKRMWNIRFKNIYSKITAHEFGEALKEEFSSNNTLLTELLFDNLFNAKKEKAPQKASQISSNFSPLITARIDIKLLSTTGDFQIVSVSDDKALVEKPAWLQVGGVGYMFKSYAGKLEFVAQRTVDGQIDLNLRGIDVRDPNNDSKRIPYWIDYTALNVNDDKILNSVTSAWHDKPYICNLNVKAKEDVKILVEWQPHKSDSLGESKVKMSPPPKTESKVKTSLPPKVIASEPKIATLQPPKIEYSVPRGFNPLTTARIDIKFVSETFTGDFQILSTSDDKASVSKPKWYQKSGIGYIIQSLKGNLTFVAKATADGQINFNLRGIEVRNPEDWKRGIAKRIPYWIDYTKLTVNEKNIFNTRTPAWCDEPYNYTMEVRTGEEISVMVEWQPHRNDT